MFRQISFPSQLPMWVDWMDQLCLPFVRVCVCACVCTCACLYGFVRVCVYGCMCARVQGFWGDEVRERVATPHCILPPLWWPLLSPFYSSVFRFSKQLQVPLLPQVPEWLSQRSGLKVILSDYFPTLLWGTLVSTLHIWDLLPTGELPAVSRGKRLNIGCPIHKNKQK